MCVLETSGILPFHLSFPWEMLKYILGTLRAYISENDLEISALFLLLFHSTVKMQGFLGYDFPPMETEQESLVKLMEMGEHCLLFAILQLSLPQIFQIFIRKRITYILRTLKNNSRPFLVRFLLSLSQVTLHVTHSSFSSCFALFFF